MEGTPDLVVHAVAAARRIGFPVTAEDSSHSRGSASKPGNGRFLAMLAAGCRGGQIAELGTGAGIGSAWITSAMPADCTLVTTEIDPVRAAAAVGPFPLARPRTDDRGLAARRQRQRPEYP